VISFPKLECWNTMTKVATVAAVVNKKRVLCRISLEILRDKFGASEEESMRSVAQHRTAIQEAARKLIEKEDYEEDGSVLIRARDL
jgi:DNA-directed RNA polymerase specialized sigma54-like protein